jgi:DNA polymerase III epsilon subunit-like protein
MIIFDTETTDLIKSLDLRDEVQPRIMEFFAMKCHISDQTGELVEDGVELGFLCDPGVEVTPEITKITGITPGDVKGEPPFGMFLRDLQQFFLGEELVVGHNVTFDLDMLFLELRRLEAVTRFPWPPRRLCTVEATEHLEGRRLNLTNLHKRLFNGEAFEAHRAKSDVMATFRCLRELVKTGQVKL